MAESTSTKKSPRLPNASTQSVRERWLDVLDLSYSTQRVTQGEIETGVNVVIIPPDCRKVTKQDLLEAEIRVASSQVPPLARGVRFSLECLGDFGLTLADDYRGWMGKWGKDIAAGETQVIAFVDLAYLEAALLARLWDHGVLVEFDSPLAFFRRGLLTDYVNIHASVETVVADGQSLADTADRLALGILERMQLYANAYLQLSTLYSQAIWHIESDNFMVKLPGSDRSLSLQYWQMRGNVGSVQKVLDGWRVRIEKFIAETQAGSRDDFPKSFAA